MRWRPGDMILFRDLLGSRVLCALPMTVALDGDHQLVTWVAPGTPCMRPFGLEDGRLLPFAEWEVRPATFYGNGALDVTPRGRGHTIRHLWNGDGSFSGWYVNLQTPIRRWAGGYDTTELQLDLWIEAGGNVTWKDEDHLEQAVEQGFLSQRDAAAAHAEAERVLREWPFPTGWEEWRPDPCWPLPGLPADWASAPRPLVAAD